MGVLNTIIIAVGVLNTIIIAVGVLNTIIIAVDNSSGSAKHNNNSSG